MCAWKDTHTLSYIDIDGNRHKYPDASFFRLPATVPMIVHTENVFFGNLQFK